MPIFLSLTCGNINDTAILNADAGFLTINGSAGQVFNAKTTIIQSQVIKPPLVVVNQLGIRTWVVTLGGTFGQQSSGWHLAIINEGQTAIDSVHAILGPPASPVSQVSACVIIGARDIYRVSHTTPLGPTAACQIDGPYNVQPGMFGIGQSLQVVVSVTYVNGTSSTATTSAVIEPLYAFIR